MKFIVKLLLNGIVIVPLLMWFTEATFIEACVTAVILSFIAYWIGDQLILKASNNLVATLADAGLAFVYLWIVANAMNWSFGYGEMLITALVLGVVEVIYHRYLASDMARA